MEMIAFAVDQKLPSFVSAPLRFVRSQTECSVRGLKDNA